MKPAIVVITGLSGSGKTVAMRAIEDCGFYCVENLPPQLIEPFISLITEKSSPSNGSILRIAIGIDIREKDFLPAVESVLRQLREKYSVTILFFEAEKDILIRRFKETRRPHPLLTPGRTDMEQAIFTEKGLLQPLRESADRIIDTSSLTPHQLRNFLFSLYRQQTGDMDFTLISFGYKFGTPQNIDLLFDVRFLPNPYFVPELKELKGTDDAVRKFVLEKPQTEEFIGKLTGLLNFLIPLYKKEGKTYLTIGIGCTGGRHRSPAIVEKVASLIKQKPLNIVHRDM